MSIYIKEAIKEDIKEINKLLTDLIQDEEITIGVQVNGKLRGTITIEIDATEEEMRTKALEDEKVKNYIGQKEVKKIIAIKGKIVNIVI